MSAADSHLARLGRRHQAFLDDLAALLEQLALEELNKRQFALLVRERVAVEVAHRNRIAA